MVRAHNAAITSPGSQLSACPASSAQDCRQEKNLAPRATHVWVCCTLVCYILCCAPPGLLLRLHHEPPSSSSCGTRAGTQRQRGTGADWATRVGQTAWEEPCTTECPHTACTHPQSTPSPLCPQSRGEAQKPKPHFSFLLAPAPQIPKFVLQNSFKTPFQTHAKEPEPFP